MNQVNQDKKDIFRCSKIDSAARIDSSIIVKRKCLGKLAQTCVFARSVVVCLCVCVHESQKEMRECVSLPVPVAAGV